MAGSPVAPIVAMRPQFHTAPRMQPGDALEADTDQGLMLAWRSGDAAAFDRLYERHRGGVFRYFLRQCRDRGHAEELHHDVWLKVIGARDRWRPTARFSTWLYTIARRRLIDHWRASAPRRVEALDVDALAAPDQATPPAIIVQAEHGARLAAALDALPESQRDAFLLHVEGGLAIGEIAQVSGALPETVKSRLRYAYARLRSALGDLQ